MINFNTGREYTENGQRIIAQRIESGEIIMLDIDRHIDLMLPADIELTQKDVMWAYDHNVQIYPNDIGMSYTDYYAAVQHLRESI